MKRALALVSVVALACGSDLGSVRDAGFSDAGLSDGGATDASRVDADTGERDATVGVDAEAPDGGPTDPCADRPPVALPIAFDMLYGNASPSVMRFEGVTDWVDALEMEFPDDSGRAKRIRTRHGEYAVIAFETSDVSATEGSFITDNPQITRNTGAKLASISRCPGDFRPEGPNCVRRLGVVSNLNWAFADAPFSCTLERDQQYYLNILFTGDEDLPAEWACTVAPTDDPEDCAMLFNTVSD